MDCKGKAVLEPSAGKGNLVDEINAAGAKYVLSCETHPDLRQLLFNKSQVIAEDFFTVTSDKVSHIDLIIMNPPFANAQQHILHAFNIAPQGTEILALCNSATIANAYTKSREELLTLIKDYGQALELGNVFTDSEHTTGVKVSLVILKKGEKEGKNEFDGFFTEEDEEAQANGLLPYNVIRDLVNRYVQAVKIYDEQLETAVRLNALTQGYFFEEEKGLTISFTRSGAKVKRDEYKKAMQKSGWKFVFEKLNMGKYTTQGLKEDINKFVETQTKIPFTMRNIYRMLEIVAGTTESRMEKALEEVFDRLTRHYHDNRYNVEGWKTNSHYLLNKKFIVPHCVHVGYAGQVSRNTYSSSTFDMIEDFVKALCYVSGDNYSNKISLEDMIRYPYKLIDRNGFYINEPNYKYDIKIKGDEFEKMIREKEKFPGSTIVKDEVCFGSWFDWGYFRVKAYKKGTLHIEFKNLDLWARFNQRVAKIKGYPLYEHKKAA